MLKRCTPWTLKDILLLPWVLLLWPLVYRNYSLRQRGLLPDRWYWGDVALARRGFVVEMPDA